jgi:regulator of sigma E protease
MEYIIYFAITIGILVFVHEFGHFAAAKLTGMRAEVFAIGFGKRLFGWNRLSGFSFGELPKDFDGQGNTDYRLCLLPLGGYVKISGMVDESFDTEFADKEPQPYEFRAKSTWRKIIVITAGVIMNLLLSLIIFWCELFPGQAGYYNYKNRICSARQYNRFTRIPS